MIINVDSDKLVEYSNRLEKLGAKHLPIAVKNSLNSVAFDMKKNELLKSSEINFTNRSKSFFKAKSRVQMAQLGPVNSMRSIVGMVSEGMSGSNNYSVEDLNQQESGGSIKSKSFIPTKQARQGSNKNLVAPKFRLSRVKKIININDVSGVNLKEKFIRAALLAKRGGYVLTDRFLVKIDAITKIDGNLKIKTTRVYSYKKGRSVHVKATNFAKNAAVKSHSKIDRFFVGHAKKIIDNELGRKFK